MDEKIIKIVWAKLGGHIHCRVYTGYPGQTLANCGSLAFDEAEWPNISTKLSRVATLFQSDS